MRLPLHFASLFIGFAIKRKRETWGGRDGRLRALNSEIVYTRRLVIIASQTRFIVSNQVNSLEFPFSDWTSKRLPYLDIFRASRIQLAILFTSVLFEYFESGQKFEYKTDVYHSTIILGSVLVLAIQAGEAIQHRILSSMNKIQTVVGRSVWERAECRVRVPFIMEESLIPLMSIAWGLQRCLQSCQLPHTHPFCCWIDIIRM